LITILSPSQLTMDIVLQPFSVIYLGQFPHLDLYVIFLNELTDLEMALREHMNELLALLLRSFRPG